MSTSDVSRLQAQIHRLEVQVKEKSSENERIMTDLNKLREANKRGDKALRQAQAVIDKSRDKKHIAQIMEEVESYQQQSRALQDLLRQNVAELERYKKLAEGASASEVSAKNSAERAAEMRERILTLSNKLKEKSELEETLKNELADFKPDDDPSSMEVKMKNLTDVRQEMAIIKEDLEALERKAESESSAEIKASRERQKREREAREKTQQLEDALTKAQEMVANLTVQLETADERHQGELAALFEKMNGHEAQIKAAKAETEAKEREGKAIAEGLEEKISKLKGQIDELKSKKARKDALAAEKEATKRMEAMQDALRVAQASFLEERERADKSDAKAEELSAELTVIQKTNSNLNDNIADLGKKSEALEQSLTEATASIKALEEKKVELEATIEERGTETKVEIEGLRTKLQETSAELEALKTESAKASEELKAMEERATAAENSLDEKVVEHKIAQKMVKQLNKDLKSALAQERDTVSKLKKENSVLASARKSETAAMASPLRRVSSAPRGALTPRSLPATPPVAPPTTPSEPLAASSTTPVAPTPTGSMGMRGAPAGTPSSVVSVQEHTETVRMLGDRLQKVLANNEAMKEKVRYLENIVQELSTDLEGKKKLVGQLSAGKIPSTSEAASAIKAAVRSAHPVATLQHLLHRAMQDNARLKRDMQTLAASVKKA